MRHKRRTKKWCREHTSITINNGFNIEVINNIELHTRKMLSRMSTNVLKMRHSCLNFSPEAKRIMALEIKDRLIVIKALKELLD